MLDIPFAYSSNGDAFCEYDFLTGKTKKDVPLENFPTKDELVLRYYNKYNNGLPISEVQKKIILQPYYSSSKTYAPRYYQRNAINRTVEKIASGQKRLLLVMATGTGKTFVSFQIVYRLLQSKMKKRILYLADRNVLIDQTIRNDFSSLEKNIYKINFADKKCLSKIKSHEINFALYHQMIGQDEQEHFRLIPKDYFDLIIIDECHRGSAKEDSNWRKILEYFSSATQIGLTATPKESERVSNIDYFGDPVYIYSLAQGIDDGFLAPFKVITINTNISDEWRPTKNQVDKNGNPIQDRIYNNNDYDYNIIIEDRIEKIAAEISNYLKSTDRLQKTIVFCASEEHALQMQIALNNQNSDIVKDHPDYCVRITGSDDYGKSKIAYFISISEKYPVIATTSELLTTGVDTKMTKLIVLDKKVESMTTFKQIIGRGTRINEEQGKTNFVVMDFRGVTKLFADEKWDGPIEQVEGYGLKKFDAYNKSSTNKNNQKTETKTLNPKTKIIVDKDGCEVIILNKIVKTFNSQGKLLKYEDIIDYTRRNLKGEFVSLSDFIQKWKIPEKRFKLMEFFKEKFGVDLKKLKIERKMEDQDDFDFICHLCFDVKPKTRKERVISVRQKEFLNKYPQKAQEVLNLVLDEYAKKGISEIEDIEILKLLPFKKFGHISKIINIFGGKEEFNKAISDLKSQIYYETE
ncbi:EcoAI/FtnUII family type I restriction enzme subunit R [Mycoplasma leonicaptivi]|uniref:EcoAI/FtnUII family type I restriction enzme subunit R n=1 Tax=Mycoplasma leonicaptivi TaxID=36742 RepID=UPI000A8F732B|nr:DEAD/DEAH box helicase family protein [Mycoplasma leonicaptivi]